MGYCSGSGENIGKQYGGEFKCPCCDMSWATSDINNITIPNHAKCCEHDSDNDYCSKCGGPQGSMRDMIVGEIEEQLDRG